ncbi:MAG: DUF2796 domain-containing protein [Hyphomicrobiaceae bacterium]
MKPNLALTAILSMLIVSPVFAGETLRQLDAHEHGHSTLNIGVEGQTVTMELEAPGADIVGFEHRAASDADKAKIEAARAALAKPLELFRLSPDAECRLDTRAVELEVEHSGSEEHGEHATEKHVDHDEEKAGHAEFHATYVMKCAKPHALTGITFKFFEVFAGAEELEVNIVTAKGQHRFEVERDQPVLNLAGMI